MCTRWWRTTEADRTAGFTLIEVAIVIALTATIFAVLSRVLSRSLEGYARQAARAELYQNGRVAQDRIARELRAGGVPTIGPGEIVFPYDSNGDDVFDATMRFAREGDRIIRQRDADPPQVLAGDVAELGFEGTDLTTITIRLTREGTTIALRTAVRHAN